MNKFIIATIIIFALFALVLFVTYQPQDNTLSNPASPTPQLELLPTQAEEEDVTITPMQDEDGQLQVEDLKVGIGTEAVVGKKITVNYIGTLTNGTQFDSSYDRGIPFDFVIGEGSVIQGWDEGLVGMKVGGKRKLTIPPALGYGPRAVGNIPPNSTLVFEVELLKVE